MTQSLSPLGNHYQPVDVLMPIHNGERFLTETLSSLIAQSHSNWHLVAVLDRCSDDSEKILRKIIPTNKLTILIVEYGNVAKNLNYGLKYCPSEIIIRIDSDDVMNTTRIEKQVSFLQNNPHVSVVGSNLIYLNDKSEHIGDVNLPTDSDEIARTLLYKNCIAHPSVAFRKNALIECGLYSEFAIGAEDYDLWLRLVSNGKLIMNIPEKLTLYRIHDAQVSRKKLKRQTRKILAKSQNAAAHYLNEPMLGIRGRIYLIVKNSFISKFISVSTNVVSFLRRN